VTFEWRADKAFLVERWTVPIPEAPDGLALIGWDASRASFLQHYFDDRGVARVYQMRVDNGAYFGSHGTRRPSPATFRPAPQMRQ
jgi:hypothetical protein